MKMSLSRVKQPKRFDFMLSLLLILIFISSIIAILASSPLLPVYLNGTTQALKQIQFYILGFIVIIAIMYVGNDNLFEWAKLGYKIVLGLLIYLFINSILMKVFHKPEDILPFCNTVNGATSWLNIPLFGTLQPSEFMKVILIIISAYIIREHNENKVIDSFESDIELFIEILKWITPPLILILIQPDTGIFMIITLVILIMLACSGIRREWMIYTTVIIAVAAILFFYLFYFQPSIFASIFGNSYKTDRIYGWLQTEKFANSAGLQLYNSYLAIGSSGLFGHGFQSTALNYIPEAHTDFIFAIIGLNFGFVGCIFVVGLCFALDFRLYQIATRCNNHIEKMMVLGFMSMLLIQQIQNISMTIGLLPITGITLPLISYGGSSLLSYMIAFGIIFNVSAKAKKLSDYVY